MCRVGCRPGLSPRVRGNLPTTSIPPACPGSIPACAGEPNPHQPGANALKVYPRVCGGTAAIAARHCYTAGLSPRVRGNPPVAPAGPVAPGSIPACAGEPLIGVLVDGRHRVYPRVCGGTSGWSMWILPGGGLSPRVRGNHLAGWPVWSRQRSIPACAGEPGVIGAEHPAARVYPRVCGGTRQRPNGQQAGVGLSPRVRGNRRPAVPAGACCGSIPACAGEPGCGVSAYIRGRVYPRVCGGTRIMMPYDMATMGLSPRVRGNPGCPNQGPAPVRSIPACAGEPRPGGQRQRTRIGSIPACAGEPCAAPTPPAAPWVYPRVCGGTVRPGQPRPVPPGLSPRVRGNRVSAGSGQVRLGSIPACAGEPCYGGNSLYQGWVYPRVCGGTRRVVKSDIIIRGLSPRVRGNPAQRPVQGQGGRSIPACAGEPYNPLSARIAPWVYPRVCGGTDLERSSVPTSCGLSPRVRGNQFRYGAECRVFRSIPACAGEPPESAAGGVNHWVYPRVCGGTTTEFATGWRDTGLSPRVRGNRDPVAEVGNIIGSIPACAGEPRVSRSAVTSARVYPRVCGGTVMPTATSRRAAGLSPRVRGNRYSTLA